jgi:ABC-2 type transport system ATP-binding protein
MLTIEDLHKAYSGKPALRGVTLQLPPGQWAVLLGPNGAGKSTLFQILTGLFAADQGRITVQGLDMARDPWRALRHIGVVFQQPSLDLDLSVERNLRFHADLHGLPNHTASSRIADVVGALGIGAELQRRARELSGGTRRKVELARALLHRPAVLLMDEPTVGLDPKSRRDLLAAIRSEVNGQGTCVLWATHLVEEALAADRVVVLHRGQLLADGAPDATAQTLGGPTLEEAFIRTTSKA